MAERAKAKLNQHALQQQQLQFQQQPPQAQTSNVERYSLLSGSGQRASSPPLVPKPLSVVLSFCSIIYALLFFYPSSNLLEFFFTDLVIAFRFLVP